MLPYRIRLDAEADLRAAFLWYETQRSGLGADFLLCFEESLQRMRRNPEIYPRVYKMLRRCWLRRFPYGVFFLVEDETIIVVGVFHARRDPTCWRQRQ
jgi:toxin ParE1/3/4